MSFNPGDRVLIQAYDGSLFEGLTGTVTEPKSSRELTTGEFLVRIDTVTPEMEQEFAKAQEFAAAQGWDMTEADFAPDLTYFMDYELAAA